MASGIQGKVLEVTVVGCSKLKNTEWLSKQDPYVCLEYGGSKCRTTTCTDGGRNPIFQERFVYSLIEGLREISVLVWNSNTINHDNFIGSGKVLLHKVLSQGFDDSSWPLQTKSGRHAGEVRLIMFYDGANKASSSSTASAPSPAAQVFIYQTPPLPAPPATTHSYPAAYHPPAYPPPPPPSAYPYQPPPPASYPYSPGPYYGGYPPPPY